MGERLGWSMTRQPGCPMRAWGPLRAPLPLDVKYLLKVAPASLVLEKTVLHLCPPHNSDMSLYVTSLHLVWGHRGAPRKPPSAPSVGTCGKHIHSTLRHGWTQSLSPAHHLLLLLPLAVTCLQPNSFGLSQSPIAPRCQGPSRRTDGQQPQVLGSQLRTPFLGRSFPLPGPAASEHGPIQESQGASQG